VSVNSLLRLIVSALGLLPALGCGSSPAPTSPSSAPPALMTLSGTNLSGAWNGSGTDAQGPETFTWSLTQTGQAISGTSILEPADPADGTCGSCHKQKVGTVSGAITGTTLTLTLAFPAGGADLTPLCGITMTATTSDVTRDRIAAAYTGTTTCEGPIRDGSLVMVR
jgi:hypothetical protein